MKRIFDILLSAVALILLSPVLLFVAICIRIDTAGPVLFKQRRVGLHGRDFYILKFRTMITGSEKSGLITVGANDPRITRAGFFLRKYKLDELPQLINVLKGEMSIVGPRPEVRRYVDMYDSNQLKVLDAKPGLTDYASIAYVNENELLANADNWEKMYTQEIMPAKLELNLKYIREQGLLTDLKIIYATLVRIVTSD